MAERPICEVCGQPVVGRTEPLMQSDDDGLCWHHRFLGGHDVADVLPALRAARADLARLRALLAAYGRAVEVEEEQWSNGTEAAYIEAAAAADTAMKAIQTEAAKWREWG